MSDEKAIKIYLLNIFELGILDWKGGIAMKGKTIAITMGVGAVAGAVAIMMMPRNNPARRLAAQAASKVEDVAMELGNKLMH